METKDYITLFLAIIGTGLGLYNSFVNYKKDKREKEKIEKDEKNKKINKDMDTLKNTLYGYEQFTSIFLDMLEESQKDKISPKNPKDIYDETRVIHLGSIPYQGSKFKYMKKSLSSNDKEVIELLNEIGEIRKKLLSFRVDFKVQSSVTQQHINELRKIKNDINNLSTIHLPKF